MGRPSDSSSLLGEERVLETIEYALTESAADLTEALVLAESTSLTRFSNLSIHQNVTETSYQVFLRTLWGDRLVVVKSDHLSKEAIRSALVRSGELASTVSPSKVLPDFDYTVRSDGKHPAGIPITFDPDTASCGPAERGQIVERVCSVLRRSGLNGAGNVRVRLLEMGVGNSIGLRRYAPFSILAMVVVALDEENQSSGYQNWAGRDIDSMDVEGLTHWAAMKCLMGRRPTLIEAEPMTAILEPPAVAQLLFHLNFRSLGVFGAQSASNSDNIIFDQLGKKITSAHISIYDDSRAEGLVPMPFDFEGVQRERLGLVVDGIAKGIAHDLTSSVVFGQLSTGHAQTPGENPETGSEFGPSPQHLVMDGGSSSVSELIESTERGVLVSRIHGFVSPLSGKQGYLAGTTRDGLFLIENGQITSPIRNFRWMERIFSAFETIDGISQERKVQFTDELWFPTFALVPTIRLRRFNFVDAQRWSE